MATESFNQLTAAEAERLALLLEELGEAQQAIGKILRHGYESTHPDGGPTNRLELTRELGDVAYAIALLAYSGDIPQDEARWSCVRKAGAVGQYLHHQEAAHLDRLERNIIKESTTGDALSTEQRASVEALRVEAAVPEKVYLQRIVVLLDQAYPRPERTL